MPLFGQLLKEELHEQGGGLDEPVDVDQFGQFKGKVVDIFVENDETRNGSNGVENEVTLDVVERDGLDVSIALGFLDEVQAEVHKLKDVKSNFDFEKWVAVRIVHLAISK